MCNKKNLLKESMEHYASRNYPECVPNKRYKIDQAFGFMCCSKANVKASPGCKLSAKKVLLEFMPESFYKYELLRIGVYYIIKHNDEDMLHSVKDVNDVSCGKVVITSRTHLWSLSFSLDEILPNNELAQLSRFVDSFVSNTVELFEYLKVLDEVLVMSSVLLKELANISWCNGTMITGSVQSWGTSNLEFELPEGNLISFHGHVLWALIASRINSILGLALDFYSIQQTLISGGAVSAIKARCEMEVDRIEKQFDDCTAFILRTFKSRCLVTRINYNYFYMSDNDNLITAPVSETVSSKMGKAFAVRAD
ncbi:unnamed protein product [Camellia sinensis]